MTPADYLKKPYGRVLVPEADGTFSAEITEFPGCIATGGTAQEAYSNLEEVAESWLESTLARGQRVPDPVESNFYSGKLVARLPKSLHRKAAMQASRDGVSLNQFIVACIAEHCGARSVQARIQPWQSISMLTVALWTDQYWPQSLPNAAQSSGLNRLPFLSEKVTHARS
jgi:predicted RNase H-like HicB family nuclease